VVNRPSVPEIITVNSEALQTQIRDLLPSQNGFGSELQASNVITPIIDLTSTAEGSGLPTNLQTALAFGSITSFNIQNTTTALASSPGFWRFYGVSNIRNGTSGNTANIFSMSDGLSTKNIWLHELEAVSTNTGTAVNYDFVVFLRAGDSVSGQSDSSRSTLTGSYRQIATGDGTLVNPNGFPL